MKKVDVSLSFIYIDKHLELTKTGLSVVKFNGLLYHFLKND